MFCTSQCISLLFPWKCKSVSHVWIFVTPWTMQSIKFPTPLDLPDPWIQPRSPALQADSLSAELSGKPFASLLRFILKCFYWDLGEFFVCIPFLIFHVNIKKCNWCLYVNLISCYLDEFICSTSFCVGSLGFSI